MQQVLPDLAHFQRDSNANVRRLLLDILEKGGIATSQPAVRHATLALLLDLAGDAASAAVAKRAIAACTVQYRAAFAAVVEGSRMQGFPAELEQLWAQLQQVHSAPAAQIGISPTWKGCLTPNGCPRMQKTECDIVILVRLGMQSVLSMDCISVSDSHCCIVSRTLACAQIDLSSHGNISQTWDFSRYANAGPGIYLLPAWLECRLACAVHAPTCLQAGLKLGQAGS